MSAAKKLLPLLSLLGASTAPTMRGTPQPWRKADTPRPRAFGKKRKYAKHPGTAIARLFRLPPPDTSPRRTRGTWKGY